MCGRYSLASATPEQIRSRFPVGEAVEVRRRYNIAPSDRILAVTTDREGRPRGELLRWGLVPPWSAGPGGTAQMINARAETVAERPAFRGSFERLRCLIIADGFYEWRRPPAGGRREPFHITPDDGGLFAFAGLWAVWHRGQADEIRSATILTTAANALLAPLHDRMPVILAADEEAAWLERGSPVARLRELLHGLPADRTRLRPVGPAVNDARNDVPECLACPEAPPPQRLRSQEQMSLLSRWD
jgi:putative SOS response-associated peptidase YedK